MTPSRLERDGASIAYEVHGAPSERTPLLLTHGYSSSSEMWRPNLARMCENRRVITWDVRGHGRTTTPPDLACFSEAASVSDMAALLDACGIERAAVGGLSLGGYLSLAFHLVHPERVAGLLLCDTGPGFKNDEARRRWNTYAIGRAEDFEGRGLEALGESPEALEGAHDAKGLALAARGILVQHESDVIDSLPSIGVPVLVVVGEGDGPFLDAADYMARKIPGAEKVVIAGAGHASNIDQPEHFDVAVTSWLSRRMDRPLP